MSDSVSRKNKKNIVSLSSVESAPSVVGVGVKVFNEHSSRCIIFNHGFDIFLFLHENICCGYSLEVPQ